MSVKNKKKSLVNILHYQNTENLIFKYIILYEVTVRVIFSMYIIFFSQFTERDCLKMVLFTFTSDRNITLVRVLTMKCLQ